jgi:hypothetical protein
MTRLLSKHPWIIIVAAFVLLVSVWSCFIYVAVTRGPAVLPAPSAMNRHHAGR